MRKVVRIVLHCTSGWPWQTTESIKSYWKNTLRWKQVGYHILIHADGRIEWLAPLSTITNGVAGFNKDSVHIAYIGGLVSVVDGKYTYGDTRTEAQKQAFFVAIKQVLEQLAEHQPIDDITIVGHRDLSPDKNGNGKIETREWVKVCPTFDAIEEYGWIVGNKGLERYGHAKNY